MSYVAVRRQSTDGGNRRTAVGDTKGRSRKNVLLYDHEGSKVLGTEVI